MHDPMTLAHRIMWPIPRISKKQQLGGRQNPKFGWQARVWPFAHHTYFSPFVYLFGYELYFSSMVDIWHTDPKGDAGPACHGRKHWKWHIHHMSVKLPIYYDFMQKHVTRCSWCRQKSSKELGRVNHSNGTGVYHSKCMTEYSTHYHQHDPRGCYACSGKAAFDFNRNGGAQLTTLPEVLPVMPANQRRALSSLHTMVNLGLLPYDKAVKRYNSQKEKAKWL